MVKEYFPGGWHGHDREGRPVFLLRSGPHFCAIFLMLITCRLGQMDAKGLIKSVGEEGLTKLTLHICEEGIKLTEEASHRCFLTFFSKPLFPHFLFQAEQADLHLDHVARPRRPEHEASLETWREGAASHY